ncbi:MAG: TetR/AcrR family transcriptional regulator [Mycobacteriales bacterium]
MESGFRPKGRPRDPDVDHRARSAAVRVYAREGWGGFTLDAVAKEAGVGKAGLYLRWGSREELLIDALESHIVTVAALDTGSLRGDLVLLASSMLATFAGEAGLAPLRMFVEGHAAPELLREFQRRIARTRVEASRAAVRRGIERGEVAPDVDIGLVVEMVGGAVIDHVLVTPASRRERTVEKQLAYAGRLVDLVLAAVSPSRPPSSRPRRTGARP